MFFFFSLNKYFDAEWEFYTNVTHTEFVTYCAEPGTQAPEAYTGSSLYFLKMCVLENKTILFYSIYLLAVCDALS